MGTAFRKTYAALALLVVTSLGLAACGSPPSSTPSPSVSSTTSAADVPVEATITFTSPGNIEKTLSKQLTATSTSDAPISYTSETLEVCSISMGSTQVVALTEGTCTITASQPATDNFLAASTQITFAVTAKPDITYPVTYYVVIQTGKASGTISGPTLQMVAAGGTSQPVTMVPGPCSEGFWSEHGTGRLVSDGPSDGWVKQRVERNVSGGISMDANFQVRILTHSFSVEGEDRGYVYEKGFESSGSSSISLTQPCGDSLSVNAVANNCCVFTGWSDGVRSNPRFDDGRTNINVQALFKLKTFSLDYSAGEGGSLSGVSSQTVTWDGSATAVTAVPHSGYRFSSWSDGVTTATRTDANVKSAIDVTASFTKDSVQITVQTSGRGSVSPRGVQSVSIGSDVRFIFTPDPGNAVMRVVVDGEVQPQRPSSWTFRNVAGPHTLNVTFSDISPEEAACLANPRHIVIDGVCYVS